MINHKTDNSAKQLNIYQSRVGVHIQYVITNLKVYKNLKYLRLIAFLFSDWDYMKHFFSSKYMYMKLNYVSFTYTHTELKLTSVQR